MKRIYSGMVLFSEFSENKCYSSYITVNVIEHPIIQYNKNSIIWNSALMMENIWLLHGVHTRNAFPNW